MKLGSDTSSYTNYLLAKPRNNEPIPQIGMGATVLRRYDRAACTITDCFIHNGRQFVRVQEDCFSFGYDDLHRKETLNFKPNPGGAEYVFFKSQSGYWLHVQYDVEHRLWQPSSAFFMRLGERHSMNSGLDSDSHAV